MTDANRDALKSMLNNLINDKPEEATLDFHNYVTGKMKTVAGIGVEEEPVIANGEEPPALDTETPPVDVE